MKILPVKKSDQKECAEIIFEEFNKQGEEFTKKTALKRVNEVCKPGFSFCIKKNDIIIGLILATTFHYAKGKYVWIEELVVKKEFQRKGVGKKLMEKVIDVAKRKKMNVVVLNTKKFNLDFYLKFGFHTTDYVMIEKDLK